MKKIDKKADWFRILLGIYIFLFIFTMVNREFKPFGFDLRFIVFPLGIFVLFCSLMISHKTLKFDKNDHTGNNLLIFYCIAFFCNFMFFFNGIQIEQTKFINEILLLANTFVGLMVFYFCRDKISFNFIMIIMVISCLVLSASIFLSYLGVPFEAIMGDASVANIYYGNEEFQQKNLFGDNYRCAGYASDANYATMLLLFGIVSVLKIKRIPKVGKFIFILIFAYMIALSFSKTILIASVFVILFMFVLKKPLANKKFRLIISVSFISLLALAIILIPLLKEIMPTTLTLRFAMWDGAKELFFMNPLFGNGITSFRSFFELSHHNWYVQCHSTFWQILSEVGLIGMIFYARSLVFSLNSKKNRMSYFLTATFIIWSATYETIALPLSLFPIYILGLENPIESNDHENKKGEQ